MRRPMLLLSLLAALAGTPLRLAEAADDLARALAEADLDANLEEADGGVGDDSDATLRAEPAQAPDAVATADLGWALLPQIAAPSRVELRPAVDPPPRSAASSPRRLTLLQRFLC